MQKIEITGVVNSSKLENYINSDMIDIVYVDKIDNGTFTLLLENEIHLDNPDDKKWLLELINQALIKCQEYTARIVI